MKGLLLIAVGQKEDKWLCFLLLILADIVAAERQ